MVKFAERVEDPILRERLRYALDGKGAFRKFKGTLREYPEVEEQWFKFKADCDKEEVFVRVQIKF